MKVSVCIHNVNSCPRELTHPNYHRVGKCFPSSIIVNFTHVLKHFYSIEFRIIARYKFQKRLCNLRECNLAFWLPWNAWDSCSATCGTSTRSRTRQFYYACVGDKTQYGLCRQEQCKSQLYLLLIRHTCVIMIVQEYLFSKLDKHIHVHNYIVIYGKIHNHYI